MIFVAVGTQKFPLNRLLTEIDELVASGKIKEEVFAQIGHSDYTPVNYRYKDFLNKEEFNKSIAECDLLITHSGVATIITGLSLKKPVVVFPRLTKYGEHVDDHQIEIASSFAEKNYVLMCDEDSDLENIICKAGAHRFAEYKSQRVKVIKTIREYLCSL